MTPLRASAALFGFGAIFWLLAVALAALDPEAHWRTHVGVWTLLSFALVFLALAGDAGGKAAHNLERR